ncbi:hypothetical protein FVR03_09390 [Pontibacter qinzhouensis]|uniref:HTH cro/C1-type domain-containing protein n=1 Tax=Pontibacter qinzhouensis TaxID=2603253 RepID=A0A5C8K9X1_9BACT|nr:type II toxin-antitoxin system MqsA family antitoxin [Pontibacter qinzhouensis]TXK47404.1 hypothetical protein FVR03_09390 [Pontibacter qinzhouensis]
MKSPYTGGEVTKVTTLETIPFRGEDFEIEVVSYICNETGEKFGDIEMTTNVVEELLKKWRERYKVPSPEELVDVRIRLKLSQKGMSKLLGLGVNQYRYYENGELPKPSHQLLLRLVVSDAGLAQIIAQQKHIVGEKVLKALENYIYGTNNTIEVESTPKVSTKETIHAWTSFNEQAEPLTFKVSLPKVQSLDKNLTEALH